MIVVYPRKDFLILYRLQRSIFLELEVEIGIFAYTKRNGFTVFKDGCVS